METTLSKIQMVDLVSQYDRIQEEVDAAMLKVVRSAAYIRGAELSAFEEELASYLGVKHVVSCGALPRTDNFFSLIYI